MMKKVIRNIYSIPYNNIPTGAKVVIYAAGKVGEKYVRNIMMTKRCELVAIVDSNYTKKNELYGFQILPPGALQELLYDYILIAVENAQVTESIADSLIKSGIEKRKIIWNGSSICADDLKQFQEYEKFLERNIFTQEQRFFIFMVPEHGNGGDYLINYSEESFFKEYFPEKKVYSVTTAEWINAGEFFLNFIKPDDIIFINGGGYIGDLWQDTENYKSIVESFPCNVKFFFPNTLSYIQTDLSKYQPFLDEAEWFNNQKNTYVMFRDKYSYDLFKKFCDRCEYLPDMALFNHVKRNVEHTENKVMLCFRSDREKLFQDLDKLKPTLSQAGIEFEEISIHAGQFMSQEYGRIYLNQLYEKVQSSKCLLTDRLHGMLLAVICDVPCVAFDNLTHKVKGVYDWINDYAVFLDDYSDENIVNIINHAIEKKRIAGDYEPLNNYYAQMAEYIKDRINGRD